RPRRRHRAAKNEDDPPRLHTGAVMDLRIRIPNRVVLVVAVGVAGVGLGFGVARAAIPDPATSLVYTGVLEDNGALVEGQRAIAVELHKTATGTGAGDLLCRVAPGNVGVVHGRFSIPLADSTCSNGVQANADVFVEVRVDDVAVGARTQIGAVPYAVE